MWFQIKIHLYTVMTATDSSLSICILEETEE